jgi:hypothetical protein
LYSEQLLARANSCLVDQRNSRPGYPLDRYSGRNANFVRVTATTKGYQGRSPWLDSSCIILHSAKEVQACSGAWWPPISS